MIDTRKPVEIALLRHETLALLLMALDDGTDAAKIVQLKKDVCQKNGISRRTLKRWLTGYRERGFEGLKPVSRNLDKPGVIPETAIEEAILLRRELPSRSIPQIIEILELEGKVSKGSVKRTTLQDRLTERGYSARQMKLLQSDRHSRAALCPPGAQRSLAKRH
jgi:transposase